MVGPGPPLSEAWCVPPEPPVPVRAPSQNLRRRGSSTSRRSASSYPFDEQRRDVLDNVVDRVPHLREDLLARWNNKLLRRQYPAGLSGPLIEAGYGFKATARTRDQQTDRDTVRSSHSSRGTSSAFWRWLRDGARVVGHWLPLLVLRENKPSNQLLGTQRAVCGTPRRRGSAI